MTHVPDHLLGELLELPYHARVAVIDALTDSLATPRPESPDARWETEVASNLDELRRAA